MTLTGGIWNSYAKSNRQQLIQGWQQWVRTHVEDGYEAFLLTFMFKHLGDDDKRTINAINRNMEDCYSRIINRFNRKGHSTTRYALNPKIITCPDRPGWKKNGSEPEEIWINNGLHAHGIALTKARARKGRRLDEDVRLAQSHYIHRTALIRLHCVHISHDLPNVVRYGLKGIEAGYVRPQHILQFPRSISELPGESFEKHQIQIDDSSKT